jgi:hypothetical protein
MDDPVWRALDEWKAPPPSEDFDRRLYKRIQAEERGAGWLASLWPWRPRPVFALAAASVMALAVALVHAPGPAVAPRPPVQQAEMVDADRLERALDDMEMLEQLSAAPAPEVHSL